MLYLKIIRHYVCSFLLVLAAQQLLAQSAVEKRKQLEKQRQELNEKIQKTKKVIAETQSKQKVTLSQLKVINQQIQTRERVIANVQEQIEQLQVQIAESRKTIDTLKADMARLKEDFARNIRSAYKSRNVYDKMLYVFASKDFNQAVKRLRYLGQYSDYRKRQAELILRTQKEIIATLEKMIAIKREKQQLAGIKENEKKELEKDKDEESKVLVKLQQRESALKRQLAENERAAKKLNKAIEDIIAKEIEEARKREEARRRAATATEAKAPATAKKPKSDLYFTPEVEKLSNDFEKNKNNLPWPVEKGYVSSQFGSHAHPTIKGAMVNNNGVDIATEPSTQVRSVFAGKVKFIRSIPGMGTVVLIGHGRYYTAYAKLETVSVREGQEVNIRDIIGTVMTNQEENETEVHFEIWNMDKKENPEVWLKNR
ncbi:MAG: murein hydrolase activator EnvC family protein [Bacteroidota bacterium]